MPYVDPATVDSPKGRVRKVSVLFDTGPAGEESWSAAELEWDGRTVLGLRWNGSEGGAPIGSPQSRGHPTWFVVPSGLEPALRKRINELSKGADDEIARGYRAMARDRDREADAADWTEGLIGDGDPQG